MIIYIVYIIILLYLLRVIGGALIQKKQNFKKPNSAELHFQVIRHFYFK